MSLNALSQFIGALEKGANEELCHQAFETCKSIYFSEETGILTNAAKELCKKSFEYCAPVWAGQLVGPLVGIIILGAGAYCCASIACCACSCLSDCMEPRGRRHRP